MKALIYLRVSTERQAEKDLSLPSQLRTRTLPDEITTIAINQMPFRDFKDRFQFRLYEELEKLYNSALVHSKEREKFGVVER
jgi:DNA invertase Pin-like site-specific DNA recombinase